MSSLVIHTSWSRRPTRPFDDAERDELRRLWSSDMLDKEIEVRLGRGRGVFRREAERLGLPPRLVARRNCAEAS